MPAGLMELSAIIDNNRNSIDNFCENRSMKNHNRFTPKKDIKWCVPRQVISATPGTTETASVLNSKQALEAHQFLTLRGLRAIFLKADKVTGRCAVNSLGLVAAGVGGYVHLHKHTIVGVSSLFVTTDSPNTRRVASYYVRGSTSLRKARYLSPQTHRDHQALVAWQSTCTDQHCYGKLAIVYNWLTMCSPCTCGKIHALIEIT